jgi:hypothetical protein
MQDRRIAELQSVVQELSSEVDRVRNVRQLTQVRDAHAARQLAFTVEPAALTGVVKRAEAAW